MNDLKVRTKTHPQTDPVYKNAWELPSKAGWWREGINYLEL